MDGTLEYYTSKWPYTPLTRTLPCQMTLSPQLPLVGKSKEGRREEGGLGGQERERVRIVNPQVYRTLSQHHCHFLYFKFHRGGKKKLFFIDFNLCTYAAELIIVSTFTYTNHFVLPVTQFNGLSTYSPNWWPACLFVSVLSIHVLTSEVNTDFIAI